MLPAVMALLSLATRPLLPVDETRYLGVAWEMWHRDDFLVPHLNGQPYSHKPPLLFWLIHFGWRVFGVNEVWPRLLPALLAVAALALVAALGRDLFAEEARARQAVWALLASALFLLLASFVAFDLLLTVAVLAALLGLRRAVREPGFAGWGLLALATAAGLLAKGPVVLLHLLPVALLAPFWSTARMGRRWVSWYLGLLASIGVGVAIALAWALPAAARGGPAYRHAIFFGQTAGRLVESFAHDRPWYWYLPLLPLIFFPLFWWPLAWRALRLALRRPWSESARFCLGWALPPFLSFSAISGKQPQYLVPLVPAMALLVAGASDRSESLRWRGLGAPASGLAIVGLAMLAVAWHPELVSIALPHVGWLALLGVIAVAVAGGLARCAARFPRTGWTCLAAINVALWLLVHLAFSVEAREAYEVRPMALVIAAAQANGLPTAFAGEYHDQFAFAGRLRRPVIPLRHEAVESWAKANPSGRVVDVFSHRPRYGPAPPLFVWPFRGQLSGVWAAEGLRAMNESTESATRPAEGRPMAPR